ncbi:hypothetical protein H8356DRAFT_25974 [Neocallimastix lanati (nom. inval.)]|nr:hypothetical protein H8356DRAFT_25974 [Neocallimastix sp. JGI-2020a]
MFNFLTGTTSTAKKHPYKSTLCHPQRKTEPNTSHLLAIPEELETIILSDKDYPILNKLLLNLFY